MININSYPKLTSEMMFSNTASTFAYTVAAISNVQFNLVAAGFTCDQNLQDFYIYDGTTEVLRMQAGRFSGLYEFENYPITRGNSFTLELDAPAASANTGIYVSYTKV